MLLVGLAASAAEAKKSKKIHRTSHRTHRMRISKADARAKSLASWPGAAARVAPPGSAAAADRTGVPELDRLLADKPPVGSNLADPVPDVDLSSGRKLATDKRPADFPSGMLSSMTDPVERLRQAAAPYLGAPYRTGGSDTTGFDCSGFVLKLVHRFGAILTGRSSPDFWRQGQPVERDSLQAGDLLFFSDHSRHIGHVAIYLADGKFVHATLQQGVVVSEMEEKYYKRRYKGARRLEDFSRNLRVNELPPAGQTSSLAPSLPPSL